MTDVRKRASTTACSVAELLKQPEQIAAIASAPENIEVIDGAGPIPSWTAASLGSGHIGVALMFAELAASQPARMDFRDAAVAHMRAGFSQLTTIAGRAGLHAGLGGAAFTAMALDEAGIDCGNLLPKCLGYVIAETRKKVERLRADPASMMFFDYDVIGGLTGIARVMLRALGPDDADVRELTGFLASLAFATESDGRRVPGWWAGGQASLAVAQPGMTDGHFNVGQAHGVSGLLAYLSVAIREGVSGPGLFEGASFIADWLARWYGRGRDGANWPNWVSGQEAAADGYACSTDRMAWCYGTPGIARTLQLAAGALKRSDLEVLAFTAMGRMLESGDHEPGLDLSLCHGWAGLLRIIELMVDDMTAEDGHVCPEAASFAAHADKAAHRLVDAYDAALPFGYRSDLLSARLPVHRPGLLAGSAGTALALACFGTGRRLSFTRWEETFLLA